MVDSKNNHYVHSHWRAGLGRQIQFRLWSVLRKSGYSFSSSSHDSTPLIISKPGKLKPDPISKSWHFLMRMKKGAEIGFFLYWQAMKIKSLAQDVFKAWLWVHLSWVGLLLECRDLDALSVLWSRARSFPICQPWLFAPSQESTAMASLSSPCFTSKWQPQPKRTEDFVSDSPVTGTAEISRFPTSWQNFPCVSKTPGKGFAHRLCVLVWKPGVC